MGQVELREVHRESVKLLSCCMLALPVVPFIPGPSTLTLNVLVMTIDAQWEGIGDVGSARYEPVLVPPCPTIRVFSYSNK